MCERCHALVHEEKLEQIAAGARMFEEQGNLRQARDAWLRAAELLPKDSTQAQWVRDKAQKIVLLGAEAPPAQDQHNWAKKLGPLAPIAIVLAKSKVLLSLFKLKFLLSLGSFMALYWTLYGAKFGVGFALLILLHEMGHYIDIKRRGLPADMPVFLPGLGAYVRWAAMGVTKATQAAVSLAGPLAGWIGAAICALVWWKTGNGFWAALARSSAMLNVLNLIPVWILDGGKAIEASNKTERLVLLTASLALWILLGEGVFFFVAAGVCWRLFTKDIPPQPSYATTAYYAAVLTALGVVIKLMPGQGFGTP